MLLFTLSIEILIIIIFLFLRSFVVLLFGLLNDSFCSLFGRDSAEATTSTGLGRLGPLWSGKIYLLMLLFFLLSL